jgi:hypothetical protein
MEAITARKKPDIAVTFIRSLIAKPGQANMKVRTIIGGIYKRLATVSILTSLPYRWTPSELGINLLIFTI